MSDGGPPAEPAPVFFVGHHDSALEEPHSLDILSHAHELGYDFVITPITNAQFDTRVIAQLKRSYDAVSQDNKSFTTPMPAISPLSPEDTTLTPNDSNMSFVAKVSPWIDLDSYDHVGFQVFRQVLNIEVAYAAFCGINNIILHAPKSHGNMVQFARAVREALGLGPYVHVHILFQMTDGEQLDSARSLHHSQSSRQPELEEHSLYDAWEAWSTIQGICSYSHKLSVGMSCSESLIVSISMFQSRREFSLQPDLRRFHIEVKRIAISNLVVCSTRDSSSPSTIENSVSLVLRASEIPLSPKHKLSSERKWIPRPLKANPATSKPFRKTTLSSMDCTQ